MKLLKDDFPIYGVGGICDIHLYNHQLGWTSGTIQTPWTNVSHPPWLPHQIDEMTNECRKYHKIACIKFYSLIGIGLHPLQSTECLCKAWPKPKA
jgi:hypothetical protein